MDLRTAVQKRAAEITDDFEFHLGKPRSMGEEPNHRIVHLPTGSELLWQPKSGHVVNINVPLEHQRQGIATALWNRAHEIASSTRGVTPPRHSPDRTKAGDAWARSVGGRVPPKSDYDPWASTWARR